MTAVPATDAAFRRYPRVARACGVATLLIGIIGIIGWVYHLPVLKSIVPGYKPIAISATICFLIIGGVQVLLSRKSISRGLSKLLFSVTLLITLFGLLEVIYLLTGFNLTLEDSILKYYPELYRNPEAHISPVAGILVFFIGLAQSLYLYQWVSGRRVLALAHAAGILGSLVILLSAVFLLSYLYRIPLLYHTIYLPIAALATLAALLSGIGIIGIVGSAGVPLYWFAGPSTRARLLKAFFPLTASLQVIAMSTQFYFTRQTSINPALSASFITIIFLVLISYAVLQATRIIGVSIDRAEADRARAQEELREINETLEQRVRQRTAQMETSIKELEAFSYTVAHDLRSPLRALNGFSRYLLEHDADQLDARGQDYLARISAAAQRMGRLIDDLLNLARIGRAELHIEKVDLSALAAEIFRQLRAREPARRVTDIIAPNLQLAGDRELLRLALELLLENAWKYTGTTPEASIEVGEIAQNEPRVYYIRDNGVGFDMAYADKLYQPFQRLHTEAEFPGIGIGLAIVSRIITRHGSRVWAEGTVGEGATFYFTIGEEQHG